uniref:Uncharacterized protein n=1 Tax=Hordeum vulgare subsp. vulgare TaxID=112509 RepID=A0A8I6YA21_HORVV
MGGDIAVWSARQTIASYDERDHISIFTVLSKIQTKLLILLKQTKTRIIKDIKMIKLRKSTRLRHPRKELAALALQPGRAKALRRQLRMF